MRGGETARTPREREGCTAQTPRSGMGAASERPETGKPDGADGRRRERGGRTGIESAPAPPRELYGVDGAAAGRAHDFVAAGGHPGDLLELGAEMRHAGVAEPESDLAEREFVVDEQFFHTFDLLGDEILLDGPALGFGEERTDLPVIGPQARAGPSRSISSPRRTASTRHPARSNSVRTTITQRSQTIFLMRSSIPAAKIRIRTRNKKMRRCGSGPSLRIRHSARGSPTVR